MGLALIWNYNRKQMNEGDFAYFVALGSAIHKKYLS